jgi:hypothetical protein
MQAIVVRDRDAGLAGLSLTDLPDPHAAQNDVIVRVHAAGFTPGERRPRIKSPSTYFCPRMSASSMPSGFRPYKPTTPC